MTRNDIRDMLADPHAWRAAKRRRETQVINMVQQGVRRGDFDQFNEGLNQLDFSYGWRRAMRAIARLNVSPPDPFRRRVLEQWIENGDYFRNEVNDDLALVNALRKLLPVYKGPGLRLWRGDTVSNRRWRTYGLPWSRQFDVADKFARSERRTHGGSVVLETDAPPDAIICIVEGDDDHYDEKEVLVDRRRLTTVRVIARYEQLAHHEVGEQQLCEELT